jgi:tetratricopeptide (TPR) repeat protein
VNSSRRPDLEGLYHRYLEEENTAAFIKAVSSRYLLSTLERLAVCGNYVSRRAAIMAIGFIGDYRQNAILGQALVDRDRGVRLLADNGLRSLWRRDGNVRQREQLARICRLNHNEQYEEALREVTPLIEEAPWFAEAWNQRGICHFAIEAFEDSANDCHQTIEINPYHFGAAVGLAHSYLELDEPLAALENFRRALRINPDLEDVRVQVNYLERTLEGR